MAAGFCRRGVSLKEIAPVKDILFTDLKSSAEEWEYWPLKKATDLQEAYGLSLNQVASLSFEELADEFDKLGVKWPERIARKLLNTLLRLSFGHPEAGLPIIEVAGDLFNARIPLRSEPKQLRLDLATAYRKHKQSCRPTNSLDAERSLQTLLIHVRRTRAFMGALRRAPGVKSIGPNVGIEQLTTPKLAKLAFDQLKEEGYAKTSISMIGYSVAALFRDVVSETHPHLTWLEGYLGAHDVYPAKAMPFGKARRSQQLLADGGAALLMAAPRRIERRSDEAGIDRKDSTARLAYAVAASLKIHHLGITEGAIVRFNIDEDIFEELGCMFVRATVRGNTQIKEEIAEETRGLASHLRQKRMEKGADQSRPSLPATKTDCLSQSLRRPRLPLNKRLKLMAQRLPSNHGSERTRQSCRGSTPKFRSPPDLTLTFTEIKDLLVEILLEQAVYPSSLRSARDTRTSEACG